MALAEQDDSAVSDDKQAVGEESGANPYEAAARRRAMRDSVVPGGGQGDGVPRGNLKSADEPGPAGGPSADAEASKRDRDRKAGNRFRDNTQDGINPALGGREPRSGKKLGKSRELKNIIQAAGGNRKAMISLILGGSVIGMLVGGFFLLAPFKLMFMKENIDQVRMARMNYILDRRSDRFLVTMLKAEIAGHDAGGQNRYFIAKGWVGSGNPFTTWYTDMKTGEFFDEMEKTQGVRFVREFNSKDKKDRLVKLVIRGETIDFSDLTKNGGMVFDDTEKFERLVEQRYETNKEARQAWNAAVKQATQRHQIIKRYTMRKWGRERLGITKWRFFENTREKADDKVRQSWNKNVQKAANSGTAIKCLFNIGPCPRSDSINDTENVVTEPDPEIEQISQQAEEEAAQNPEPENPKDPGKSIRIFAKKIVAKFIPWANILDGIDTVEHIDTIFKEKKLSKLVSVYRAHEYALSYFSFATLTDHLKAGKDVSGPEVNAALSMFNGIEHSDGYQQVTRGTAQTAPLAGILPTFHKAYAADTEPFDKVDDTFRVNGGSSNASKFEDFYSRTFGKVLTPLLNVCRGISLCKLIHGVNSVLGGVIGLALRPLTDAAGTIFTASTGKTPEQALSGVMADMTVYLAGSSKCSAKAIKEQAKTGKGGGRLFNCVDGGAAVTQEAVLQSIGAGQADNLVIKDLNTKIAAKKIEDDSRRSSWSKLASLDTGSSLLARMIMASPASGKELARSFQGLLAYINPVTLVQTGGVGVARLASQPFHSEALAASEYADTLDDNLYGVVRYAVSDEKLDDEPFSGKGKAECDKEMEDYKTAVDKGESPPTSMCTLDTEVGNSLSCLLNKDPNCAKVGEGAEISPCLADLSDVRDINGQAQISPTGAKRKIVMIGDSLFVGSELKIAGDIRTKLQAKGFKDEDIIYDASGGRGITYPGSTGNKTSGERAVRDLSNPGGKLDEATVIVVELGTNTSGTPAQFKSQVSKLVKNIKLADKEDDALIYWVSIISKGDSKYPAYNDAIEEVAEEEDISVITPKGVSLGLDRIHPDTTGYKTYAKAIVEAIDSDGRGDATQPDCSQGEHVIAGDAQEIAQKLKELMTGASPKVTGSPNYLQQITDIADGKAGCNVDEAILKLIYGMTTKEYSVSISSLNRFCTKVLTDSGPGSNHYRDGGGHAVDFQAVNGQAVDGGSALSIKFIKDAEDFMLDGTELGQVNCRSTRLTFTKKVEQVNDACNHVHIGFNKGAE